MDDVYWNCTVWEGHGSADVLLLYCILLRRSYSPFTAPTSVDLHLIRHRASMGFKYRCSTEDVKGLRDSELRNEHDHTLLSHRDSCVVSDCARVGWYCSLQNRVMPVPGPTHLMKIQWNFSSLCWNMHKEKPFQGRGRRGWMQQVGREFFHDLLFSLTASVQPRVSYCFDLTGSFFHMLGRLCITLINKEREEKKRNDNSWLLELCFPNIHKLIPLSMTHLLFLSSHSVKLLLLITFSASWTTTTMYYLRLYVKLNRGAYIFLWLWSKMWPSLL